MLRVTVELEATLKCKVINFINVDRRRGETTHSVSTHQI